ncbi:fibrinogen-like protein 1 [Octopus sinensis]|uniref:Fibrinogen-like protein 1 n=1 Tax=Octopus sinensis TaxID=2607531 RepID=A0A6P7SLE4_9MOLL|nr:fibrinogen-like protein 1 [Octopus sinensis]XP_036360475.1 fibrinogen-like protein 1 [Octopus sinensis]
MARTGIERLVIAFYFCLFGPTSSQESICSTMQFRRLGSQLQNEHQCMILEKLQSDVMDGQARNEKNFALLIQNMNILEARVNKYNFYNRRGTSKTTYAKDFPALKGIPMARDCYELYRNGIRISGVYPIKIPKGPVQNVWCELEAENSGWTVIQRRRDGSENFTRKWNDYAFGFGNVNGEYYFGNENIHKMTRNGNYTLRIELSDWENDTAYAQYTSFYIDSEKDEYKLHVSGYNGTAGDALNKYHNGMLFSTIDKDNDEWAEHCALKDRSGWWFRACGFSSLNGLYTVGGKIDAIPNGLIRGIIWYNWKNDFGYSLKMSTMKIKPYAGVLLDSERARKEVKEEIRKKNSTNELGMLTG